MNTALLILGAVLSVAGSAVVSAAETGSYTLNRVRLRVEADRGTPNARRLARLIERQSDLLMMALAGNTLADYVCTACLTALLVNAAFSAHSSELWATAIVTPSLLVLGQLIPKEWFRREADRWMYPLAWPLTLAVQVTRLTGFPWLIRHLTGAIVRRFHVPEAAGAAALRPRASVVQLLHEGAAAGGLTTFQRDMIERVIKLAEVHVANVMIPRPRVASVPRDIAREDFLRMVRMAHFSRMPVWERDPRRVVGVVNVYDVLTDQTARPISEYLRAPLRLAESTRVSTALLRMQRARAAMAVVEDRAGQCTGILTLKDLVEEIVGDLEVW